MASERQPVIITDTTTDPRWVRGFYKPWQGSYAGAPLISQDEVIGFLNLGSVAAKAFSEEQSKVLKLFADEAALAIANARLYESVKSYSQELEARNIQLDAFAHTVAHDLRAPLQIVQGYLALLEMEMGGNMRDDIKLAVNDMQMGAQRMDRLIKGLLLLSTENGEMKPEVVDMTSLFTSLKEQFRWASESVGVDIVIEGDLPPAHGYSAWLESAFGNLIDNAIKFIGMENEAPRVILRGRRDGDICQYEVIDNGLGIKDDQLAHVFKAHKRFGDDLTNGYGLGLSIVDRILEKSGGQIAVRSEYGVGSTFQVTLPAPSEED